MTISGAAKSVSCPRCNARVVTEALVVKEYVAVRLLSVANSVHVTKKGMAYASIRADDVVIDGFIQGDVTALYGIRLSKRARVKGDLRASSLSMENGATLEGHVRIGPAEVPELQRLQPEQDLDRI